MFWVDVCQLRRRGWARFTDGTWKSYTLGIRKAYNEVIWEEYFDNRGGIK